MNDLSGADGREVAVALVGEDEGVLADDALGAGGDCGCTAVSGFVHIAVEVIIRKDGAADRRDADDLAVQVHLVDDLGHQAVNDAVVAAGAVMELLIGEQLCLFE